VATVKKEKEKKEPVDNSARISFSYPKDMKEDLIKYAEKDNRSLSSFIQVLLKEGIKRRKAQEENNVVKKHTRIKL